MRRNNNPAGGSGGAGQSAPASGGADDSILPRPAPPVKPLSVHLQALVGQAEAFAARALFDAEVAKSRGDYAAFCRLRRLGLRHQVIWDTLQMALQKECLL